LIGFRTTSQDTPAQSLVYADGILLSNLLGNYYLYPPFTQMVTPNEISRVDVIYGPFSATRVVYLDQYSGQVLGDTGFSQYGPAAKAIEWGIAVHQG
jgi:uncharacterized iron-regulated membrane protein